MSNTHFYPLFLNGTWLKTQTSLQVSAPYDGRLLAQVSTAGAAEIESAIQGAVLAKHSMFSWAAFERAQFLRSVAQRLLANKDAHATLLSLEAAKPLREAIHEIERAAETFCIAAEEALHFSLLSAHLQSLGFSYGDFAAHNSLWEMAEKTTGDVLARMALVPRTLEARGLDATPGVRNKLAQVGDVAAADILDIILRDEIGHVDIGNRWYHWCCEQRGLDVLTTYQELTKRYKAPILRGPFNLEARRQAGFMESEIAALRGES